MKEPDKIMINRWMEGRLEGDDLAAMEQWAAAHPEILEQRMGWETTGSLLKQGLASEVEPPYADFFNHKIAQAVQVSAVDEVAPKKSLFGKFGWFLAPAMAAAMALCFYIGTSMRSPQGDNLVAAGSEVYIPQEGVTAQVSEMGNVTVIALEGLEEIPESLDIVRGETSVGASQEYYVRTGRENQLY